VLPLNDQGAGAIVNLATNLVLSGLANKAHYVSAKSVGAMRVLCSPEAPFVSGQVLTIDAGLTMH
jgi:hypothetical protein